MTCTITEHIARHPGGWLDPEPPAPDHIARHAHDHCRRRSGDITAPAKCLPCVIEVMRVRQEMRDELAEFIRTDDGTDSGRAL